MVSRGRLSRYTLCFLNSAEEREYQLHVAERAVPLMLSMLNVALVAHAFIALVILCFFPTETDLLSFEVTLVLTAVFWSVAFRRAPLRYYQTLVTVILLNIYWTCTSSLRNALHPEGCTAVQHSSLLETWFSAIYLSASYITNSVMYINWRTIVLSHIGAVGALWAYVGYTGPDAAYLLVYIFAFTFSSISAFICESRDRTNFKLLFEAKAGLQAKSSFLANQNHEMRTLLNGIIGMQDLLLETGLTSGQAEYLSIISKCSESLLSMVCDVLDLEKATAGKLDIRRSVMDVRGAVESVCDMVSVVAEAQRVELAAFVDDAIPTPVLGDSDRLKQVLLNLVSNAVKFSSRGNPNNSASARVNTCPVLSGSGHVMIHVVRVADGDAAPLENASGPCVWIRFAVRDNGIGIRGEDQTLLFQPFTQVDTSHTRMFQGTGLGLSICKKLTEAMGGSIGVCSTPRLGSTFFFTVPFPVAPDATPTLCLRQHLYRHAVVIARDAYTLEALTLNLAGLGITALVFESAAAARARNAGHVPKPSGLLIIDADETPASPDAAGAFFADLELALLPGRSAAAVQPASAWALPRRVVVLVSVGMRLAAESRFSGLTHVFILTKPVKKNALVAAVLGDTDAARLTGSPPPPGRDVTDLDEAHAAAGAMPSRLSFAESQSLVPTTHPGWCDPLVSPATSTTGSSPCDTTCAITTAAATAAIASATTVSAPQIGTGAEVVKHGGICGKRSEREHDEEGGARTNTTAPTNTNNHTATTTTTTGGDGGAGAARLAATIDDMKRRRLISSSFTVAPAWTTALRPADTCAVRLLCAEDNLVNTKVLSGHLIKIGYAFDFVTDGRDAVDRAVTGMFTAILMDIQMPVMSGYEATVEIRRLEASRRIAHRHVIIGCSANALSESRDEAFGVGMDAFITKPLRRGDLEVLLAALVGYPTPVS